MNLRASLWLSLLALLVASGARAQQTAKPLPPQVSLWVARDVAPGPKIRLSLNTRNVPSLRLTVARIADDWLTDRLWREKPPRPDAIGPETLLGQIGMVPHGATSSPGRIDDYRSKQVNLPPLRPGAYRVTATGGGKEAWGVVHITQLAVIVKRAPQNALVWVTDHRSGRTIAGARVRLATRAGKTLAEGVTGGDGTVRLDAGPSGDEALIVRTAGDAAAVAVGSTDPDGRLIGHFTFDRPIYRPGQSAHWKAILRTTRGQGYAPVAGETVAVEVRDARENVLERTTAVATAFGTVSGTVELPDAMALGPATVVVSWKKQNVYGAATVAAYRKPEFTVTATPERSRWFAGEKLQLRVEAKYLFGAPVPGAHIRYQVRRTPRSWWDEDSGQRWYSGGDGNLYPGDNYRTEPFVTEGQAQTGADGSAQISVATQKEAPDSDYQFTVTVTDSQNRQVEVGASVPVLAAALRLGLALDDGVVPLGATFPVRVRVADVDGRPVSGLVDVRVERQTWDGKANRWVRKEVARAQVRVARSGVAQVRLPAQADGNLQIVATAQDPAGRTARAFASIWVASPDWKPDRTVEPELQVRLDKSVYAPGQVARAFVTTNVPTRPILATLEGRTLFAWKVFPAGRTSRTWEIPADLALAPNASVEATQWAAPARRIAGNALLALPDRSRQLNVSIAPDRTEYRPGDTARALVRVTDRMGKPVSAEVAVGVIDAAVLALRPDTTPELFTHFWGIRANQVNSYESAPEELSGGAFQRAGGQNAPLRQRFVDTAFWDAHRVTTAADGTATVELEMPGNLTTWAWSARAVTVETRVGQASASTISTRPLTLRLGLPRQATVDDRWLVTGTVNNRTDAPQTLTLRLSPTGVRLDAPAEKVLTVPARAEAQATWGVVLPEWPAGGKITFEADARDASGAIVDRLQQSVPALPRNVVERTVRTTLVEGAAQIALTVTADEPRSLAIQALGGLGDAARASAREVLRETPYSPGDAADTLRVAAAFPELVARPNTVRDALLLLSRAQNGDGGWGAWEAGPSDAWTTARVLRALAATPATPERLRRQAEQGAQNLYRRDDYWERRALLAAALGDTGFEKAAPLVEEVNRRAANLSPYARLALGDRSAAQLVGGAERASIAVGAHPGWSATATETAALALSRVDGADTARLARGLAFPDERLGRVWRTRAENAAVATALAAYLKTNPEPANAERPTVAVNGGAPQALGADGRLILSGDALPTGSVTLALTGRGFVAATLSQPRDHEETIPSTRLIRRLAMWTPEGLWREVPQNQVVALPAGAPLRVTVLAWPSENAEIVRVAQTLPAGFEWVEDDSDHQVFAEARDNEAVHLFRNEGRPVLLRFTLRAERSGLFRFPPALMEDLRDPSAPEISLADSVAAGITLGGDVGIVAPQR